MLGFMTASTTQFCFAEESRFSRLADSRLLSNLTNQGIWKTKVSNLKINYSCLTCAGKVQANIEIVRPYTAKMYPNRQERFLSERKALCAKIAILGTGRCLGTNSIGMRGGALSGFKSKIETKFGKEIEIVFFYHEKQYGSELIKTTIRVENEAKLPEQSIDMFLHHMTKLTLWW
jgi:hypothetical protein